MKTEYISPEIEVLFFGAEDIITTSNGEGEGGPGSSGSWGENEGEVV